MKGHKSHFIPHSHLFACERCGFVFHADKKKVEWTGAIVCGGPGSNDCFEQRHPQDYVRGIKDNPTVDNPSPDPSASERSRRYPWRVTSGAYTIDYDTNSFTADTNTGDAWYIAVADFGASGTINATLFPRSLGIAGVILKYLDSQNFTYVDYNIATNKLRIQKLVGGFSSVIDQGTPSPALSGQHTLNIVWDEDTITVTVDGGSEVSTTDYNFLSQQTEIGILFDSDIWAFGNTTASTATINSLT